MKEESNLVTTGISLISQYMMSEPVCELFPKLNTSASPAKWSSALWRPTFSDIVIDIVYSCYHLFQYTDPYNLSMKVNIDENNERDARDDRRSDQKCETC